MHKSININFSKRSDLFNNFKVITIKSNQNNIVKYYGATGNYIIHIYIEILKTKSEIKFVTEKCKIEKRMCI